LITLQEFVRETLREVVEGVREAQEVPEIGGQIAPDSIGGMKFPTESGVYYEARILATTVKFDVAVTAEVKTKGETGAGIQVAVFSAKAGGEISATDMKVSRVQFAVPLVFPKNTKSWS
jgi:hypothetical protein